MVTGTTNEVQPLWRSDSSLALVDARRAVCGADDAEPLAVGEDFEYRTSPDSFLAVRCRTCGLVYLERRPAPSELARIYPDGYHAFNFSAERFGLVYRVRRRLEARRLLAVAKGLSRDPRILDVGCGDGFHLGLLAEFGRPGWRLEGIDPDPAAVLIGIRRLLKPGGRLLVVTDNTGSPDFTLFRRRHWGGYHFPRHFNLFDQRSFRRLSDRTGWEVDELATMTSPVNRVCSIPQHARRLGAPKGLVNQFSLESAPSLSVLTAFDAALSATGRGALLRAVRQRPEVFANLRFEGRGLLPDVVMWVPDRSFETFRLTELERLVPDARRRYLGCRVVKTPIAYPVFSMDYEDARADLAANGTGVDGLVSVGRNGEFDHILMEDIYWRTKAKVQRWVDDGSAGGRRSDRLSA